MFLNMESTAMHHALSEIPLALFTTLFPMAIGAFIAIAIAFWFNRFTDEQTKKIDKLTIIPLILIVVSFLFAMLHLKSPLNAIWIFANLGSSPLSNEILGAAICTVIVGVYWLLAFLGKLSYGLRRIFLVLVVLAAIAGPIVLGFAYRVPTIITWASVGPYVYLVGNALLGGVACGIAILHIALGSYEKVVVTKADHADIATEVDRETKTHGLNPSAKIALAVVAALGFALAIGGAFIHQADVNSTLTAFVIGSEHFADIQLFFWLFFPIGLIALILTLIAVLKDKKLGLVAFIIYFIAVLSLRLVFYGTYITVGM